MSAAKLAISIDEGVLRRVDALVKRRVFRSRSEAIQSAITEKLARLERNRLAGECAKLSPAEEQQLADEGLATDREGWPVY